MPQPGRVLLIDDDLDHLILCNLTLRKKGYEVITLPGCEKIEDLREVVDTFTPHLIFMDHDMRGICGKDLARYLKSSSEYSQIPIIYFTGRDDIVELAREAGADGYLRKPFRSGNLLEVTDKYLVLA